MYRYYAALKKRAEKLFNYKPGKGRQGSVFRVAMDVWKKSGKIYFNGTHADYRSLSFYWRPSDRTNQNLEGKHNVTIALGKSDQNQTQKGSFERWIATAKKTGEAICM